MSSKNTKQKDDVDDSTEEATSETSERKDQKKKKHGSRSSRKAVPTAPPGSVKGDGGLNSRMFGVPGSTPGCTAGAYATEIDPDDLPELNFASCFPEHAEAGKQWLAANQSASPLSLLLSKWGPEPSVMDRMNKWLIRRVGRKCADGTEEGRKDMAAFAANAIKTLRSLPPMPEATKLYRAVPWKAMGKLAPGMSEFCEESNIVWPTFTSLVKSEERARNLLKEEGGFLYIIEACQARDVTALAPVQSGADEIMLEPNSQFVITSNENDGNIFIVGMKQEFPSLRPIMKEVDSKKKHHHHRHHPNSPVTETPSVVVSTPANEAPKQMSVVVKAPPSPSMGLMASSTRVPSFNTPQSNFRTSSSRLSMPMLLGSRRGSIRDARPTHRVHAALKSDGMTMWSVGKGYLTVHSVKCRDKSKVFKLKNPPSWTTPSDTPVSPCSPVSPVTPSSGTASPMVNKLEPHTPEPVKSKGAEQSEEAQHCSPSDGGSEDMLVGLCADPGFGSMVLAPNQAPNCIVTGEGADMRTIGGVTPSVLLNRVKRGVDDLI